MQNEKEGLIDPGRATWGFIPRAPDPGRSHFSEYIRAAHRMHSPKWKLTNRDLSRATSR
ncbi:MAG: hypothetical protein MZV64_50550 [Ignavibacteriales bacterium]|nr:hypothetical protein [Ignavibacteriales bacterium]